MALYEKDIHLTASSSRGETKFSPLKTEVLYVEVYLP